MDIFNSHAIFKATLLQNTEVPLSQLSVYYLTFHNFLHTRPYIIHSTNPFKLVFLFQLLRYSLPVGIFLYQPKKTYPLPAHLYSQGIRRLNRIISTAHALTLIKHSFLALTLIAFLSHPCTSHSFLSCAMIFPKTLPKAIKSLQKLIPFPKTIPFWRCRIAEIIDFTAFSGCIAFPKNSFSKNHYVTGQTPLFCPGQNPLFSYSIQICDFMAVM